MNEHPFISVIIPCRNEEKFIDECLDSILDHEYPKDKLEVLVEDKTRKIIENYVSQYSFIKVLENPPKFVPSVMNIGIQNSSGEVIVRIDTYASYSQNYLTKLVNYLISLNADNVGGVLATVPSNDSLIAKAVAIAISTPFEVGDSRCRTIKNYKGKYIKVDTVPFGCYRKDVFEKIGLYDEDLIRNQDNELNERLLLMEGKIYLIPEVKIIYYTRDSYKKLFLMMFQYGYFGPLVDKKLGRPTRIRRYIPSIFVIILFLSVILSIVLPKFLILLLSPIFVYSTANIIFSLKESIKEKNIPLVPFICFAYFCAYFDYGVGYLKGFIDFVIREGIKIKELIQVCYNMEDIKLKEKKRESLIEASEELDCDNLRIITWDEEREEKYKGKVIKFIPLWRKILEKNK